MEGTEGEGRAAGEGGEGKASREWGAEGRRNLVEGEGTAFQHQLSEELFVEKMPCAKMTVAHG